MKSDSLTVSIIEYVSRTVNRTSVSNYLRKFENGFSSLLATNKFDFAIVHPIRTAYTVLIIYFIQQITVTVGANFCNYAIDIVWLIESASICAYFIADFEIVFHISSWICN